MSLYKIVTSKQEIEYIEADSAEIDAGSRLNLRRGDDLVGSFIGYSSFNIVEQVSVPPGSNE